MQKNQNMILKIMKLVIVLVPERDRLNVVKNIACLSDWSFEMLFFAWCVFVFSWVDYELPVIENVSF